MECFKQDLDEGYNKKELITRDLVEKSVSKNYKYFFKWANYVMYSKITENNFEQYFRMMKVVKCINNKIKPTIVHIYSEANKS